MQPNISINIIVTTIFILFKNVFSANILYFAPLASPSHHIWNMALAKGLLDRGYNITMVGHFEEKQPSSQNFTFILLEGLFKSDEDTALDLSMVANANVFSGVKQMYEWGSYVCYHDLTTKGLKTLLNYPSDHFDLIIFDITMSQCLYPVMEKFNNAPVVAVTPFLLPPVLAHSFGVNLFTSYIPFYSSGFTTNMNLMERLYNFVYTYYEIFYRNYVFLPQEEKAAKEFFGNGMTPLDKLEKRISLLLSNVDPNLDLPLCLPPNIIPVGGLHVRSPKSLPSDLEQIMNEAKHGVILFSLGTNVKSEHLHSEVKANLLEVFSKLKQTILWKYGKDDLRNVPKNVIVRKWLPQNDILGHKNMVLFMSHGGALSTQEAMYHGVPVIGIPLFCDQHVNVARMENKKLALRLNFKNLTIESVYGTIREGLENPVYSENIQKISRLYRRQKGTALERGIYWVEHILRNGNMDHLNLPSRDMPTYQRINLDVFVVFSIIGIAFLCLFLFTIILTCKFLFTSQKHHKQE